MFSISYLYIDIYLSPQYPVRSVCSGGGQRGRRSLAFSDVHSVFEAYPNRDGVFGFAIPFGDRLDVAAIDPVSDIYTASSLVAGTRWPISGPPVSLLSAKEH